MASNFHANGRSPAFLKTLHGDFLAEVYSCPVRYTAGFYAFCYAYESVSFLAPSIPGTAVSTADGTYFVSLYFAPNRTTTAAVRRTLQVV